VPGDEPFALLAAVFLGSGLGIGCRGGGVVREEDTGTGKGTRDAASLGEVPYDCATSKVGVAARRDVNGGFSGSRLPL
jgi:hypothetical protein